MATFFLTRERRQRPEKKRACALGPKIETSLTVYVISDAAVIAAKLVAGRPQELADVDALRRALAVRDGASPAKRPAPKKRPGKKRDNQSATFCLSAPMAENTIPKPPLPTLTIFLP